MKRPSDQLMQDVCAANRALAAEGLARFSSGNVSAVDRAAGIVAIKPSGLAFESLEPTDIVCVSMETGRIVSGDRVASTDTPTHVALYRRYPTIGSVLHVHSVWACVWAQAGRDIPLLGTTHADYFTGPIPVTNRLTPAQISGNYEEETANAIIDVLTERGIDDPLRMSAALVRLHGPFVWARTPMESIKLAVMLEISAEMAFRTIQIAPDVVQLDASLAARHFDRIHGPAAYSGQKSGRAMPVARDYLRRDEAGTS